MLDLGVEQHDLTTGGFGIERLEFVFERTAVESDDFTLFTEKRSELVHNPATHTDVVVLGHLTDFSQLFTRKTEVERIIQRKTYGAFQCGGR